MANPQTENGFTAICNEIMEHLIKLHLPPNQWQVLLCIIRKTYGYRKKVDYIANCQICESTGLRKDVVSRSIALLEMRSIITRQGKVVGLQKDWEQWKELAKLPTDKKLAKLPTELAELSTKVGSPLVTQKKKENIQKKLMDLPSWIDPETWDAFLEMRKFIKKPATIRAQGMIIKKLSEWQAHANAILEQSIRNSWQDVFPLKDPPKPTPKVTDLKVLLAEQAKRDAERLEKEELANG